MNWTIFGSETQTLVFWIAFAIWAWAETLGAVTRRREGASKFKDKGSVYVVVGSIYLGMTLFLSFRGNFSNATIEWGSSVFFSMGIAFMLLGVLLRRYSRESVRNSPTSTGDRVNIWPMVGSTT